MHNQFRSRPAGKGLPWPFRTVHLALIAFGCLITIGSLNRPAQAAPPSYVEEWATPAQPEDVEVDPSGRVWVSCDDDSIRVYASTGGELLFAFGGTGSADGEFRTPYGIAFDPDGEAYICDYVGARVEKFSSEGLFLLSWPIPSTNADHVDVDASGDVYVAGYTDFAVHKYTSTGGHLLDWTSDGGSLTSGVLAVGGSIFVVQWSAPVVEQFTTDGTFQGSFAASTFGGTDIEIDTVGRLWVADFNNNVIRSFTTGGLPLDVLGSPGTGPGEFNGAIGVGVGADGSIYVADQFNYRIQRFDNSAASVPHDPAAPAARLVLQVNSSNPVRTSVELTYAAPRGGRLRLSVLDVRGRTVAKLVDGLASAGEHRLAWSARGDDGRRLPTGLYFVRLAAESGVRVAKLMVVG